LEEEAVARFKLLFQNISGIFKEMQKKKALLKQPVTRPRCEHFSRPHNQSPKADAKKLVT
jgi:hypothetical protein